MNVVVKNKIVTRAIKRRTLPPVKGKKIVKRVRKLPQKVGNARNGNTRSVGNNKKVVIRRNVKFVKRRRGISNLEYFLFFKGMLGCIVGRHFFFFLIVRRHASLRGA